MGGILSTEKGSDRSPCKRDVLPNDVQPSHQCLENGLPSDLSAHQRGDDRGSSQHENDDTQHQTLQRLDAEQAEDTREEHDQTGSHRHKGSEGSQGRKIQSGQTLDQGQRRSDTPDDVDNADDDVDEFFDLVEKMYIHAVEFNDNRHGGLVKPEPTSMSGFAGKYYNFAEMPDDVFEELKKNVE